jgi:predicted secreted protein
MQYIEAKSRVDTVQALYDKWEANHPKPTPTPTPVQKPATRLVLIEQTPSILYRNDAATAAATPAADAAMMRPYPFSGFVAVQNPGTRSESRFQVIKGQEVVRPYVGKKVQLTGIWNAISPNSNIGGQQTVVAQSAKLVPGKPVVETKKVTIFKSQPLLVRPMAAAGASTDAAAARSLGLLRTEQSSMSVALDVGETFEFGQETAPSTGYSWSWKFQPEGLVSVAGHWFGNAREPQSTIKVAATGLCARCSDRMVIQNIGTCKSCRGMTSSGSYSLCRTCALKQNKCMLCGSALQGMVVGAPTTEWWRIRGDKAGTTTMLLNYARSWEKVAAAKTVKLNITVKAKVVPPVGKARWFAQADDGRYRVTLKTVSVVQQYEGKTVMLTGVFHQPASLLKRITPMMAGAAAGSVDDAAEDAADEGDEDEDEGDEDDTVTSSDQALSAQRILPIPPKRNGWVRAMSVKPVSGAGKVETKLVRVQALQLECYPPITRYTCIVETANSRISYSVTSGQQHLANYVGSRAFVTGTWDELASIPERPIAAGGRVDVTKCQPLLKQLDATQTNEGGDDLNNPFK